MEDINIDIDIIQPIYLSTYLITLYVCIYVDVYLPVDRWIFFCNIIYSVCVNGSISDSMHNNIHPFLHLPFSSLWSMPVPKPTKAPLIDGEWYYDWLACPRPGIHVFGHEWGGWKGPRNRMTRLQDSSSWWIIRTQMSITIRLSVNSSQI